MIIIKEISQGFDRKFKKIKNKTLLNICIIEKFILSYCVKFQTLGAISIFAFSYIKISVRKKNYFFASFKSSRL